jgi:hypothetical protein
VEEKYEKKKKKDICETGKGTNRKIKNPKLQKK